MIKFENTEVWGFEHAIRGMRNPMNSWCKSDSGYKHCTSVNCSDCNEGKHFEIGENDKALMKQLVKAGSSHRKFLRQIFVSVDITAPLYWFKEYDTYKVGTVANSTSTMHKLTSKPFEKKDFSFEKLEGMIKDGWIEARLDELNDIRDCYVNYDQYVADGQFTEPIDKKELWYMLVQMLPSSYNQKRTVTMTYENLLNMYEQRKGHKLDEWGEFCGWILGLPYSELLEVND